MQRLFNRGIQSTQQLQSIQGRLEKLGPKDQAKVKAGVEKGIQDLQGMERDIKQQKEVLGHITLKERIRSKEARESYSSISKRNKVVKQQIKNYAKEHGIKVPTFGKLDVEKAKASIEAQLTKEMVESLELCRMAEGDQTIQDNLTDEEQEALNKAKFDNVPMAKNLRVSINNKIIGVKLNEQVDELIEKYGNDSVKGIRKERIALINAIERGDPVSKKIISVINAKILAVRQHR